MYVYRRMILFCMLFFFYEHLFSQVHTISDSCAGKLINGVCWAESNVDSPGTFAATPEAYGMLYQWNRRKGWSPTGTVSGWDTSFPTGDSWETANDPCPVGWRVPTIEEMATLQDGAKVTSVQTSQNGVYGRKFTDKVTSNVIFLPGVSYRSGNNNLIDNPNYNGWYWSSSAGGSYFAWMLFFVNTFDVQQLKAPGIFGYTVRCVANPEWTGCDSIVKDTSETICAGDLPYTWGDTIFQVGTTTGKFRFLRTRVATGCDSIVYLTLTVHPVPHLSFSDVVCYGNGYTKNGFNLPVVWTDTLVSDTLQSVWGCDSIRSLYLMVNPVHNTPLNDTICQGDSYHKHGFSLANVQTGGSHSLSLLSQAGCDSILSLHLTVLPAVQQIIYDSICPSSRYIKHGFDLSDVTASGSFQLPLKTKYGCDSIVTLDLYVYPTYFYPRSESICQGDTIDFRGRLLYENGIYYDTLTTIKGCDSIYCMNLTVSPVYDVQLSDVLCEGSSYTKHGFDISQAGLHYRYLKTISGCDSIITLNLTEEKKIQGRIGLLLEDCITHAYTFFFESEIPVSSYKWDMGDGTVYRSEKGVHAYVDSGVYRIQLRTETHNSCKNTFSYVQHVPHYIPEVQIHSDRQIINKDIPVVNFCADVLPEMTCVWDFGNGMTGEGTCVSHTYNANSEKYYDVVLRVINADGCVTESRIQIEVVFLQKLVNTFSPNGDGINDVFMKGYRVEIVNRNGLRVYVGSDGWDGTYKGGQAQEDTYFYRLYYQTESGEKIKTGYVTLIR